MFVTFVFPYLPLVKNAEATNGLNPVYYIDESNGNVINDHYS